MTDIQHPKIHRVVKAASRAEWRPDIQGLRAVAVLLVVAYHADFPIPGGFVGVDMFFVISGYVITGLLLRQHTHNPRYYLRTFWAGRIRRILPALAIVVMTTLLLSALLEDTNGAQEFTGKTAIAALLMVSNVFLERSWPDYFLDASYLNPLLNTWSLGVEEQFYLLFPLLFLVVFRWFKRAVRSLAFLLVFVIATSFLMNVLSTYTIHTLPFASNPESFAFYSMTTRAWQLGSGALLMVVTTKGISLTKPWRNVSGLLGVSLIAISAFALDSSQPYPGYAALLPTLGALALIAAGIGGSWLGTRALDSRPGRFFGDRSYSLYLWHWPLLVFAGLAFDNHFLGTVVALLLTLLLSIATYSWVENPFRFAEHRGTATAGALSLVAIALVISGGFTQAAKFGWGQTWTLGAHKAMQRDCDEPPLDPDRCRWGEVNDRPFVLVVGDSQAWASGNAVIDVTASLSGSTVISAYNSCPFTAGLVSPDEDCADWQKSVMRYLENQQPDAVVIANADSYGGAITAQVADEIMGAVADVGPSPILLLNPPPGDELQRNSLLFVPPADRFQPPSESQFTNFEIEELRSVYGASSVLDPTPVLCTETSCVSARDGIEYYTDSQHLSVDGAALLKPLFSEAIANLPDRHLGLRPS